MCFKSLINHNMQFDQGLMISSDVRVVVVPSGFTVVDVSVCAANAPSEACLSLMASTVCCCSVAGSTSARSAYTMGVELAYVHERNDI
jgi:hypothetical protein